MAACPRRSVPTTQNRPCFCRRFELAPDLAIRNSPDQRRLPFASRKLPDGSEKDPRIVKFWPLALTAPWKKPKPCLITFQAVQSEINAGRPIIVAYRGSSAGHVVIIHGYDAQRNVYIHDPLYGSFVVPYGNSFSYGGQFIWSDTIYGIG